MSQSVDRKPLLLLVLGVVGVLTILYSTRWGIGLYEDSFWYLSGAESLLRGHGFRHVTQAGEVLPITHWPPLFPLSLTPFGLAGMSLSDGARWLHALIFGANILLVGYAVYKNTSIWPAVFASFLILSAPSVLTVHPFAQSEPLYLLLGLCGLWALDNYLNKSKTYPLILSALFISAAALTRYVGVTLIATLCISVLVFNKRPWRQRFVDCFIAGLISSLPLLLWFVRNQVVSGGTYDIPLQIHLITFEHIKSGLISIALWFPLPQGTPRSLVFLAPIPALALILVLVASLRKGNVPLICYLHALYILVYCLFLALFISVISFETSYNPRYLSTVFVSVVIILGCFLHRLALRAQRRIRIGIAVLCVLFAIYAAGVAFQLVRAGHEEGWRFEGRYWGQMGLINSVNKLPSGTRIYSNSYIPIGFLTNRDVKPFPKKYDEHTGSQSGDYLQQLQSIGTTSKSQRTVIVYYKFQVLPYFPTQDELKQILSLREMESTPDGSIYEVLD